MFLIVFLIKWSIIITVWKGMRVHVIALALINALLVRGHNFIGARRQRAYLRGAKRLGIGSNRKASTGESHLFVINSFYFLCQDIWFEHQFHLALDFTSHWWRWPNWIIQMWMRIMWLIHPRIFLVPCAFIAAWTCNLGQKWKCDVQSASLHSATPL